MTRCGTCFRRFLVTAAPAWWLVFGGPTRGHADDWDRPPGGFWELGANWADGSPPGTLDTATFNVAGTYLVEFGTAPQAIRELNVFAGNVTFNSPGAFRTLNVTSTLFGGPQDVNINPDATLTLGTVVGFSIMPLHLTVGNRLRMASDSTLNVRFGSDVVTAILRNAGQVIVSGFGSSLRATSADLLEGTLNVEAGGIVETAGATINAAGIVAGAGSQWIDTNIINVGSDGILNSLNILDGGKVQSPFGSIGIGPSAHGLVSVDGAGSQWTISSALREFRVGESGGSGTLNVTGGGSVSSAIARIGGSGVGTATITGGAWTTTGQLIVGGTGGQPGTLNIQSAGVVSAQNVILFPNSNLNLQGGTLDASSISYDGNQGPQFIWTSGTLHVGTFDGSLTNSGGRLAPGHSAGSTTVNGNYTQVANGVLEIEIGVPLGGSNSDVVNVTGSAQLGGTLDLTLLGGPTPTAAESFAILNSNDLSGDFDNVASGQRLATSDGIGSFVVNYGIGSPFGESQVVLSDFQLAVAGDFDLDGDVDGADLLVWQRGGSPSPNSPADLAAWRGNFGSGGSAAAIAAVPEPRSVPLLLLGAGATAALATSRRLAAGGEYVSSV